MKPSFWRESNKICATVCVRDQKSLEIMGSPWRLLSVYSVLNTAVLVSYLALRDSFPDDSQLFKLDPFGFSRVVHIVS